MSEEPRAESPEPSPAAPPEASPTSASASAPRPEESSWGFPRFARDFPRDPELDALVGAFARGDYLAVRERAPRLASSTTSDEVKRAATLLRERIEPDPTARALFVIAAALLAVLTCYWIFHDSH